MCIAQPGAELVCVCARQFSQVIRSFKTNLVDVLIRIVIWSFYTSLVHLLMKKVITYNLLQITCITAKAMSKKLTQFIDQYKLQVHLHFRVQASGPLVQAYVKQSQISTRFAQTQTHFISR